MFNSKDIYPKFSKKKFKILNISSCLFADSLISYYIYMMYARPEEYKKFFKEVLPILKQLDPNSAQIAADPMFREQLTSVMVQTAISLICFYLIVHLLIYVARVYEKAFANSYIKFYAWSAGILMTLTALLNLGNARIGIFIIPGLLFLFNAFGFKYVNQMQEE